MSKKIRKMTLMLMMILMSQKITKVALFALRRSHKVKTRIRSNAQHAKDGHTWHAVAMTTITYA
jgi:hypothetical protein